MHQEAKTLDQLGLDAPVATGDCWNASFDFMFINGRRDRTMRLCHGVALVGAGEYEGLAYGHAWCEVTVRVPATPLGNMTFPATELVFVIDKSNGRDVRILAPLYYSGGRLTQIHRYTYKEMAKWALETDRCGPWELEVDR